MRSLFAFLLLMFAVIPALPARAEEAPPAITTTGQATVYVVPDKVVITLGVHTFDPSLDQAKKSNENASSELVTAIKGLGIDARDVGTDRLQVNIEYKNGRVNTEIEGYYVQRTYSITIKDAALLEKLVDTALKSGANWIGDISFQNTELRKYRDQARQMAIHAAKEKAVALAKELDCTVGKPRSISESSGGYYGYNYSNRSSMAQNAMQEVAAPAQNGETLPLGKIAIDATVSVTFELK